jgi:hypothetical protein
LSIAFPAIDALAMSYPVHYPHSILQSEIGGRVGVLTKEDEMDKKKDQHDKAVEDSFPASDPPAATGITGPRVNKPKAEELDDQDQQQKNE